MGLLRRAVIVRVLGSYPAANHMADERNGSK
jgi:hypothetical protein